MSDAEVEFANDVHAILTADKAKEKGMDIKSVSDKMGLSYDTLYSRLRSDPARTKFSLKEILSLIRAVDDIRLLEFFTKDTSFIVSRRANHTVGLDGFEGSVRSTAAHPVIEAAQILNEVEKALVDEKVCHQDKIKIAKEINETERALALLRLHITNL